MKITNFENIIKKTFIYWKQYCIDEKNNIENNSKN